MFGKLLSRVSAAPTNPHADQVEAPVFDVADLYRGPATVADDTAGAALIHLDEKLRQAYFWIVNSAVISPFYDIEFNSSPPMQFPLGDSQTRLTLPTDQSYCSFALLPLLTFATRRKCLLVGGPGRGKTSTAILMGVLAGYSLRNVRRAIQKGQPQMTVSDLLGSPLPADMIQAKSIDQIAVAWRNGWDASKNHR